MATACIVHGTPADPPLRGLSLDPLIPQAMRSFTRLTRFMNRLMRAQLACEPVTVQQCHALQALADGSRNMTELAAELGLHQSTLTRLVARLEQQGLARRTRVHDNQRMVRVALTAAGEATEQRLDACHAIMVRELLAHLPARRRKAVVDATATLADLIDPERGLVGELLACTCAEPAGPA